MAFRNIPGTMGETYSLADVLRNQMSMQLMGQQVEQSKMQTEAFRKQAAADQAKIDRQNRLRDIMAMQPSTAPVAPLPTPDIIDGEIGVDSPEPTISLNFSPQDGEDIPLHVRQYRQLTQEGFLDEANELMQQQMDQFKVIGDINQYNAAEYYNKNIAPITGQAMEYSEPEDWTTPKSGIDESSGKPVFFTTNKKTGETEVIEGFGPMPKSGMVIESDGQGGFRVIQGDIGSGGWQPLTKSVTTQTQKDLIALNDEYERALRTAETFRPEFLEMGTKVENAAKMLGEKLGVYQPEGQSKKDLEAYVDFKRNAIEDINMYIKRITGAQMSEKEAGRIRLAKPDPGEGLFDGDSPTQFKSKMNSTIRSIRLIRARREYLLKNGFTDNQISNQMKKNSPPISLKKMGDIIKQNAERIYNELKEQDPAANDIDLSRKAFERAFANYGA